MENRDYKHTIQDITNIYVGGKLSYGEMMDMDDINDILAIKCIGQVPDDIKVVTSANRGEPVVGDSDSQAGKAYENIVGRLLGEDIPFMEFEKEGFFKKLMKAFKLSKD